ncbi:MULTISPECIES: hypothetical protein [Xanthomonas]|uniref:Pilin n=1 Tax=Xanthomonas rydalmerensis TaxID=3046274 RepID=A0ABZ0JQC4_9XANT|nr:MULTISPECIES: hypothetical protein [unclassified Xanthomonas]MBB5878474.1 Flp pilus assembly pilin Flp [Xanthomonas sp. 3498]MXV05724.1 hypothetical protein [Xanthomonas sp. LMG 9002]WOS41208.1 hypothetical protein QN243_01610 [Xanthomonas sp. DM-2023]WOS45393.1 hypothetical protein QN242_01610 [Xanthomonas sp. DM-2023]WOS49572.1 hypothetical protein QN240_01610 [Xanthomonas sp. DM-2023]
MNALALPGRRLQRGQSTIEYTVVVMALVIVLIAKPDVITEVVTTLKELYAAFVYAISVSDVLTG